MGRDRPPRIPARFTPLRTRGAMGSFLGVHMASVQGQSPWSGAKPPEAESFLALGRATDRANLHPLQYFQQSIAIR